MRGNIEKIKAFTERKKLDVDTHANQSGFLLA